MNAAQHLPFPDPPHLGRGCIGWQSIAWIAFQHTAGDEAAYRMARAVLPGATTVRFDAEVKR